jgi:hypothetical protein
VLLAVSALALTAAAAADAAPLTIGQMPASAPPSDCSAGPYDTIQHAVSSGRDYKVPEGYTKISSWSTYGGIEGDNQELEMKVLFHVSGNTYTVVAHDGPRAVKPGVVNTFPVDINVYPELVLALNDLDAPTAHNACAFSTGSSEDVLGTLSGNLEDGFSGLFPFNGTQSRMNIAATLAAPPGVDLMQPASGPTGGGTRVLIAGHDLTGASGVRFGSTPAASFKVVSDSAVTAVSPAGEGLEDVTVTTIAGTTPAVTGDRFTYEPAPVQPPPPGGASCVVPKLTGKALGASRRALSRAGCRLGEIRGHRSGAARVRKQSAAPGKVLPSGSKVNVKLAKPRK